MAYWDKTYWIIATICLNQTHPTAHPSTAIATDSLHYTIQQHYCVLRAWTPQDDIDEQQGTHQTQHIGGQNINLRLTESLFNHDVRANRSTFTVSCGYVALHKWHKKIIFSTNNQFLPGNHHLVQDIFAWNLLNPGLARVDPQFECQIDNNIYLGFDVVNTCALPSYQHSTYNTDYLK